MEKFTKEEIETAQKVYESYIHSGKINTLSFRNHLISLLEPKRKKIVVEIEYQARWDLNPDKIRDCMESNSCYYDRKALNFVITELPEAFSKSDMINFANYNSDYPEFLTVNNLSRFLETRNK